MWTSLLAAQSEIGVIKRESKLTGSEGKMENLWREVISGLIDFGRSKKEDDVRT